MLGAAAAILDAYFSICVFRNGPREMPAAGSFLAFSTLLYALSCVALVLVYQPLPQALLSGLVETVLLLVLTWLLLAGRGLRSRFPQTGSALTGTGFLFSLFALPLFLLRNWVGSDSPLLLLASLLLLVVIIWNIAVLAHILRQAVEVPFAGGVLLAIAYVWLISTALAFVSPVESAA